MPKHLLRPEWFDYQNPPWDFGDGVKQAPADAVSGDGNHIGVSLLFHTLTHDEIGKSISIGWRVDEQGRHMVLLHVSLEKRNRSQKAVC